MDVRKTNGSLEEYDKAKLARGIHEAYKTAGQYCDDAIVVTIINNLYIYDGIASSEIRRQVEESLMSINKKVALAYIEKFDADIDLRKKRDFIKDYIAASNAATGSKFDSNANVTRKNIVTLGNELYKENNIKQNRYIMCDKIKSLYGKHMADHYLADLESHLLYKHDESGTPGYPYCVAITMYPFLINGLKDLGGVSVAPTDLKSFCGEFINLVYSVSSQFMGAVATPEFLMYMDYFIRKDYGEDYLDHLDDVVEFNVKRRTLVKVIDNYFQQVIHSMNMPAGNRGYQTVFWNIGYFDKPYFEGVFSDFRFPDGSAPRWETLDWLQRHFMNWFNEERNNYILTFPVETMALLTDGKDDYVDKSYADFTAEMWSKGHSFFCYISNSADSRSSCCRLRNSLKDVGGEDEEHNHTTHQYSMGTASVSTGSKSVMTINLNRLIQESVRRYFIEKRGVALEAGKPLDPNVHFYDKDDLFKNYINKDIREMTERVHKAGFIDMKRQYLTIGVNGLTEAAEFLGLTISPNPEYGAYVNNILETINICNRKDRTKDAMFNTEFVPAENLAAKNYKWDKKDGYFVSDKHNLYSSYFYNPEDEGLSMIDKFKLHGEDFVKYLDGGSALHMNIAEHLTKDQYRQLLNVAAHYGTNYFTFNCRNTVCNECGYISKDTLQKCPKCGSENLDYLTRVIGYLKRISSFAEPRQVEADKRFYTPKDA